MGQAVETVIWRPVKESELEMVMNWRMLTEITKYMYTDPELTLEGQKTWYEASLKDKKNQTFMIEVNSIPSGILNVTDIDTEKGICSWGYYIAVKEMRSLELAMLLEWNLYDYVFETLHLKKLTGEIFKFNKEVLRIHQMCGSVKEGELKQHICKHGEYYDVVITSITKEDWKQKKKKFTYKKVIIQDGVGDKMYALAERLFPICRSITGDGVRETLRIIKEYCERLSIYEVPSGTQVCDWTIPKEWNIREAYIEDEEGNRIVDFKNNNLHVLGYSAPMDCYMSLKELKSILYTIPNRPDWIPYVTSYYAERSGFCMTENQKNSLKEGRYHTYIDSDLKDGSLTYGEILIPGKSKKEIFLSSYICHPSMANNECSGPSVLCYLANWIESLQDRKYSYRILLGPETIGAINYISLHLSELKEHVIAGFMLSCVGDNNNYTIISSPDGNTLADKVMHNVLVHHASGYQVRDFLVRGSDERQYCSPGVELPYIGFCRTKYAEYAQYHTSADDMSVISPDGLEGSFEVMKKCILALEGNEIYRLTTLGEPQLGKRGLYPTVSRLGSLDDEVYRLRNLIAFANGKRDLLDISNRIGQPMDLLIPIAQKLHKEGLLKTVQGEEV